jgi:hypothetical protein
MTRISHGKPGTLPHSSDRISHGQPESKRRLTTQEVIKPFADFADPRNVLPDDYVITRGSPLARAQLTMGDCYRAREALEQFPSEDINAWPSGELLRLAQSRGADTNDLRSTHDVMVKITQDISVPEGIRKSARVYLAIMAMQTQPPQTLPVFMTQDEMLVLIELITATLLHPNNANGSQLRAVRKSIATMFCGAPEPLPTDRPVRWEQAGKDRWFVDEPHIGRYLVQRVGPHAREFKALLNGKPTTFRARTPDEVKAMVERTIRAHRMGHKP